MIMLCFQRGKRYRILSSQQTDSVSPTKQAKFTPPQSKNENLFAFKCNTVGRESVPTANLSSLMFSPYAIEHPGILANIAFASTITEDQSWKAMELAILCAEYGK